VAVAEGRALAESLFGPSPARVDLSLVASAVFTLPPLATVGPTEAEALAAGHALRVFEADFRPLRQAFVGGHERTYMKLLVDADSDRVLAVHMLGADAPEIVQGLAVALTAGATKAQFDRTLAVHPTAAEEFVLMREPSRVLRPGAGAAAGAVADGGAPAGGVDDEDRGTVAAAAATSSVAASSTATSSSATSSAAAAAGQAPAAGLNRRRAAR